MADDNGITRAAEAPRGRTSLVGGHRWQVLVFFTEFLYMGLELLASRVLSPYFGTTLDVWTAILGTVLLASAVGNYLGGRVADGDKCVRWLATSLMILMASFFVLPVVATTIGQYFQGHATVVGVLLVSLVLFALPGICIGSVTPMAVALHGRDHDDGVGRTSADIYVAMTIGGIVGTFMTGFVLVPLLGSTFLSYVMGGLAFVLSCIVGAKAGKKAVTVPFMAALVVSTLGVATHPSVMSELMSGGVDFWQDTQYGHVHVFDRPWGGEPTRILNVDGGFESAMYLAEGREEDLVFDYTRTICDTIDAWNPREGRILCLGGGAYSIPRHLVTSGDKREVSVMEIDDGVTDVARKWFHLAEVEEQVGDRMNVISGDARVSLAETDETYDIIVNDTFAGNVPVRTLATKEAAELVKAHLSDHGIYISNVIGKTVSDTPDMLAWELETLKSVFRHVHVIQVEFHGEGQIANHIIVATDDDDYEPPQGMRSELVISTAETRVLTDDDSPVEWITSFRNQ